MQIQIRREAWKDLSSHEGRAGRAALRDDLGARHVRGQPHPALRQRLHDDGQNEVVKHVLEHPGTGDVIEESERFCRITGLWLEVKHGTKDTAWLSSDGLRGFPPPTVLHPDDAAAFRKPPWSRVEGKS